jgi:hypothetical protein
MVYASATPTNPAIGRTYGANNPFLYGARLIKQSKYFSNRALTPALTSNLLKGL